jgi:ABC-type dipeptide/oligopeptide/nickel transport system ATPase component
MSSQAPGCPFVPRCPNALEICRTSMPPLEGTDGHLAACWNPMQDAVA